MRVFTSANSVEMDQLPAGKSAHAVAVLLLGDRALNGVNYTLKVDGVVLAPDVGSPKTASVVEIVEYVADVVPVDVPAVADDAAAAAVR